MLTILFMSLLGLGAAIPITSRNTDLAAQYLLPTTTIPTLYEVRLFLDPNDASGFSGSVSIRILPNVNTNEIVMHALDMTINSIRVVPASDDTDDYYSSYDMTTDDTQFLKISLNRELTAHVPYVVHISYNGTYAANMFGIYISSYQESGTTINLVTSQLQPTFARRVFPCYDEPALKAIFRTTIYAPAEFQVIRSNTPERSDLSQPDVPGYVKHEYEDTLLMSSYLNAYLVSNFENINNSNNPIYRVPFNVYSRPGTQTFAEFALDFGQRNMVALENYTEVPYAFPKMDHTAVPDFAAGAMENWGLVIYREAALLVQDGVTSTSAKQSIGVIICHENMHMWFGNEVSPQSWTYTWLNEGFANFFENFATDMVLPEWRMMDQFVINMQNIFQRDAVLSVNAMTNDVYSPTEILGNFNAVAYGKSGSIIRMMQHFLTPEVFRKGLTYYLQDNARSAATPTELYAALNRALAESDHSIPYPLVAIMNLYTTQGGFPVLTITRSAPTAESVVIRQERFLTDRSQQANTRYYAPLNWVLSTDVNFEDTKPQAWLMPTAINANDFILPGLNEAEWYIFNKQQTGYYRVNYDVENWQALARVLAENHEIIHILNRAQLIDDSFNLARNGRLRYNHAFELSNYLSKEIDYIPWAAASAAFTYLETVLTGSPAFNLYTEYALSLTSHLYDDLGFTVKQDEEFVTPYLRNIVLNLNCRLGNQDCVQTAQTLLEQFRNNPSSTLNPDIQNTVYCSGLRGGDVDNFNFLWNRFVTSTDSTEQTTLLNALGCTSNEEMVDFYLNQVLDPESPVRQQNKHSIVVSVINGGSANTELAFDFLYEHFADVQNNVQELSGTTNILTALGSRLTTPAHLDKVNAFEARYDTILSAGERAGVAAMKENVGAVIAWNEENSVVVVDWLEDNFGDNDGSSASTIALSSWILMSMIIAIFNC